MRALTSLIIGSVLLVLSGCGSSSAPSNDNPDPPEVQGLLSLVDDPGAFETSLKEGLSQTATPEMLAGADAAATASAGQGNYTGTYTQEANVDELDAVRYDGDHLYVAPRRYWHCCFILEDAGAAVDDARPEPERSIRILDTDPASADAEVVGRIPLADNVSVQGMYVDADRLFAMTGNAIYGHFGSLWTDIAIWAPEQMGFQLYDVTDKANPDLVIEAVIDGVFVESRRIGNTVYLISRYTPWIEGLH